MKKGFTLIELLAVIVILAIIVLIATPIILGIIEDARKGSIEASVNGYIDAIEYENSKSLLNSNDYKIESNDVNSINNLVKVDGEKPDNGYVLVEKGKVSKARLEMNGYSIYYDGQTSKVIGNTSEIYTDSILNGADPVLKDEMVPVVIASDGTVTKADTSKEWYNYSNKEWANAVILFGEDKYKVGDSIDESSIKEYYVWIPRYSYRLWNVNSDNLDNVEKPIEIVFGSEAKTEGTSNGDMYVHPAFTNFNTYGLWVGKFELSYNEETYTNQDLFFKVNPNYEVATNPKEIIIKPNVRSLTNKPVSEFFNLLYNSHRILNSHMITNMEWGATAYLTYSVYGRCDENTCTEVMTNNINTGYQDSDLLFEEQWLQGPTITGCAADNVDDTTNSINTLEGLNTYSTEKGVLASTTGNITGIYDMSGGSWDYVMGVLIQPDGKIISGQSSMKNSGYKGIYGCLVCDNDTSGITENTEGLDLPNKKYYNAYKNNYNLGYSNNWHDYSEGLLGDATKEVANIKDTNNIDYNRGNWFNDYAEFVVSHHPWFGRGGYWSHGDGTGIFHFRKYDGYAVTFISTRAVLAF